MKATIIYEKIWKAAHELAQDGSKKYRYIVLEGSSRSSKTRSLLQTYYCYAGECENARMSVWRDTAKDCRDTVGYDMAKVYPDLKNYKNVKFHSTKSIYTFPTKSTIEVCGTDEPNKVHGYQGEVIWLNEPYKISKDTFDQLDMRTTDLVFIDWNPKQAHWIDELKKDPRTLVIHSTFKDNPFCPIEQRRKILSYQTVKYSHIGIILGEHQAKQYDILNNPILFTPAQIKELARCKENERKGSANDFNWAVYGLGIKSERPNRIFRWGEISDDEYNALDVKRYYGIDWGAVDPWAIVEAKYYDGNLYLKEINYLSENKIRERLTPTDLAQIEESDEGFVKWYFTKFGIGNEHMLVCDPNRILKIRALRAIGYNAVPAAKPPGSIVDGIGLLCGLKVFYTASSLNLKHESENYSYMVDRYGIVLEEPEDFDNHLMDGSRYVADFMHRNGIIKAG